MIFCRKFGSVVESCESWSGRSPKMSLRLPSKLGGVGVGVEGDAVDEGSILGEAEGWKGLVKLETSFLKRLGEEAGALVGLGVGEGVEGESLLGSGERAESTAVGEQSLVLTWRVGEKEGKLGIWLRVMRR